MRPDGDPEPDDYGLPPVDVVVPDDARELDRDVIAYHREERQRRRRERIRRLTRPFTRYGLVVPIIAGALLVALASGVLMTVFGPRPAPRPSTPMLAPHPTAAVGRIGGYLPDAKVALIGRERVQIPLRDLRPGVILIAPPECRCEALVAELAARTQEFELRFWLTVDRRADKSRPEEAVRRLRQLAGAAHHGTAVLLEDTGNVLAGTYAPPVASASPTATASGAAPASAAPSAVPTAVFVAPDGVVSAVLYSPQPGADLTEKIKALA
ncbi:hypothetical protein Acsp04_63310 [Actinomadura sp. NBRC 104425]|uniref:hypothetical protein n=1 Tax=Actinomadura sp. NBRC 104425 TaxID=3032204 RepID=UPI0024A20ED7|nr:hypothetical protein [Actinomadura sp. NBRC 104425]GLZ16096.1 hypothetical protein Acsp04_63310 [Actinomadura sp. NBRC 104425]